MDTITAYYLNTPLDELCLQANTICTEHYGDKVFLRGLIEFSNYCVQDCLYCGIRKSNAQVRRFRLQSEDILALIKTGYAQGLRTFVLQSGEDPCYTCSLLCALLEKTRQLYGEKIALTLSCGIRSREEIKALKTAGADRYLLRFETSDPALHNYLRNGITLNIRLAVLETLKECGYEVGSGFMVGLPGETDKIRMQNLALCRKLALDMVGIGPFIPHPETPLLKAKQESLALTIRLVAILRLILPLANIPATTSAGTLDPSGREQMIAAGANVLMPNITPREFKKDYALYPGKICIDEDGFQCINCLALRLKTVGRVLSFEKGNALTQEQTGGR